LTTICKTAAALCLVAAAAAVSTAPAFAAPSGQEYLPKVPSATGSKSANDGGSSGSSTTPGTTTAATTPADKAPTGEKASKDKERQGDKTDTNAVAPVSSDDGSSGGGSGSAPVVLLIIGGVIVVAAGMTLRRRQNDGQDDPGGRPGEDEGGPGPKPNVRPTPDGEIAGGDKPA